ncbi:hypothetical protein ACWGH3_23655 [Streptomyces sp. NPDC054884]
MLIGAQVFHWGLAFGFWWQTLVQPLVERGVAEASVLGELRIPANCAFAKMRAIRHQE